MPSIDIECQSCRATGVYCGFCEAPGEAVVCLGCGGTGKQKFQYEPFKGRKSKRGIKTVRKSIGKSLATGIGGTGRSITYAEFMKREKP